MMTVAEKELRRLAEVSRKKLPLAGCRSASPHSLIIDDNRFFCVECWQWQPRAAEKARQWLQVCVPKPEMTKVYNDSSFAGPRSVPSSMLPWRVGEHQAHHSHTLRLFRGIAYCKVCGAYSHCRIIRLVEPCGPPSASAIKTLRRIERGLLPSSALKAWPDTWTRAGGATMVLS